MLGVSIEKTLGSFRLIVEFETVGEGVTALFGRSGAGKSSIINAVAGLMTPDAGRINFAGATFFDSGAGVNLNVEKRNIGFVFQDSRLFPHMTAGQNLRFGFQRRGPQDEKTYDNVVDILGLSRHLNRRPQSLSGGEKQRVALGRAFLSAPQLMLMDEPLSGLDADRKEEVLLYIEQLAGEMRLPILYVSHDLSEVLRLADQAIVIDEGRVAGRGPVTEVLNAQDLARRAGDWETGAVFEATISEQRLEEGLTVLSTIIGDLLVPVQHAAVGAVLRLRLRARDVMIARSRPTEISVQNIIPGVVERIEAVSDGAVDVQLKVGDGQVISRVTRQSADRLALTPGLEVYAMVKSFAVERFNHQDPVKRSDASMRSIVDL
jgi:molybdate transport system ATP-binding protein